MSIKVLKTENDVRRNLINRLINKVKAEYEKWRTEILKLSKEQILENAFNIMLFENIEYIISYKLENLSVDNLQKLLSLDDVIMDIRHEWLRRDSCFIDDLEDAITDLARMEAAA